MGISALIQNAIRAFTLLAYPSTDFTGILIYYGLTAAIVFIAGTMYYIERKSPFATFYSKQLLTKQNQSTFC